jgi:hypothetical protein
MSYVKVRLRSVLQQFRQRLKVLYIDGVIFSPAMTDRGHTFTAQAFKFVSKGKTLRWKNRVLTIALPSRTDTEAWFRPLELVRAVVGNIFVALDAIFQESSPHLMLSVFELPSPLGASAKHSSEASKEDAKNAICSMVAKLLKEEDTSKGFAEFMRLLVTAEAYYRCGKSTMQAWAAASRDFAECTRGRKVALYNIYIYIHCQLYILEIATPSVEHACVKVFGFLTRI